MRAACRRHLDDLENAHERGLFFDAAAGTAAADFFSFLPQSKGEWAGRPLELEAWQRFIVESLFGWQSELSGTRRFRAAYIEIARKNGKSTLAAGLGLLGLIADGEPGAEVYSAATTRDQARIVWDEAARMVKNSPALASRIRAHRHNLHIPDTASKFEPLSSDYNKLDGLNIHVCLVDELHAHPNRELWDVLETATGSRRQPLIVGITTAGQDAMSFCGELHERAAQVARGAVDEDTLFSFIAALDEGDDWADPDVWQKPNPNLGVSVKVEHLASQVSSAKNDPAKQNATRRYLFNQWIAATTRYLDLDVWDACAGELSLDELEHQAAGRTAYIGLDLATTTDLAALVVVVEPEAPGGAYDVIPRFYLPEARAYDPEARRRDRVPYDAWADAGFLTTTPGAVIDYGFIRRDVEAFGECLNLCQLAYDPWNATALIVELEEELGVICVATRQGYASLSSPTKRLNELILGGGLRHGGHPVLRWQADNVSVRADAAGNIKPDREKSRARIDGVVALIMAIDRAERNRSGPPPPSIYATEGLAAL